ncbi:MAG TPA: hypothetical protein PKW35_24880, partial [Nannocystaceae bacterium]|nr:hypothetical protein [Nannocystaceae bacterium]
GGAGRDLTRALAIVRGPARASLRRHEQPILIDLAELAAVAGELVDAGELLRQAGEAGPREHAADLIVARPALRGLVGRE